MADVKRKHYVTIGLRASLEFGEGHISAANYMKLLDHFADRPMLAYDVIGDWISILSEVRREIVDTSQSVELPPNGDNVVTLRPN